MNRLVVDTNVLINILDKNYVPPKSFSKYDQLCVPAVVLGEYRAGLSNTRRGQVMLAKLLEYLRKLTVEVIPVTERTAEMYAKVFQILRAQGHPIPQNDLWIAASAHAHADRESRPFLRPDAAHERQHQRPDKRDANPFAVILKHPCSS